MALIRMSHVEHGYHNAENAAEEKKLAEAGWKRISDADFKALVAAKSKKVEVEADESEEVVEAPKKRGPKPKA